MHKINGSPEGPKTEFFLATARN